MPVEIHTLTFPGAVAEQGFWLYVWRIKTPQAPNGELLYVGRTGDESSPNASSAIKRIGQHLDPKHSANMIYRHLTRRGIEPASCAEFKMVAYGPIFPEEKIMRKHKEPRDKVAALEKELAETLENAGYDVMNTVNCRRPLDQELWEEVRDAFADHFCKLVNA